MTDIVPEFMKQSRWLGQVKQADQSEHAKKSKAKPSTAEQIMMEG